MSRTVDKYTKVRKAAETAPENEVKIKAVSQIGKYISYAASLLLEKKLDTVLIKASGNAARSACQIAEILRHKIAGLHQLNNLKTISVVDEYEPREEGLDRVVVERKLAVLEIALTLRDNLFDTKAPGYQQPLPKDQVQEEDLKDILSGRRGGDRGGPRGGRRGGRGYREEREEGDTRGDTRGGRGGRGYRGGRGGGRGGRYYDREEGEGRRYNDREEGGRGGGRYNDREEGGRGGGRYNDREEGGRGYNDREEGGRGRGRGFRRGRYAGARGGRGGPRGGRGEDRE